MAGPVAEDFSERLWAEIRIPSGSIHLSPQPRFGHPRPSKSNTFVTCDLQALRRNCLKRSQKRDEPQPGHLPIIRTAATPQLGLRKPSADEQGTPGALRNPNDLSCLRRSASAPARPPSRSPCVCLCVKSSSRDLAFAGLTLPFLKEGKRSPRSGRAFIGGSRRGKR